MPELPAPTRELVQGLDGDLRSAALNLRIAAGVFQPEDIDDIASLILKPGLRKLQRFSYLDSLVEALLRTSQVEKADEALTRLIETLEALPESTSKLMRALNATMRRRRSNICDPTIWAKLELSSVSSN